MSVDDLDITSVKYPRYLRKQQKVKLKLNDISINNELSGLIVSPCIPQKGMDPLLFGNKPISIKGKNKNVNNSTNGNLSHVNRNYNKLIYRLPTPSDILRSKNVNVPKVKKIERFNSFGSSGTSKSLDNRKSLRDKESPSKIPKLIRSNSCNKSETVCAASTSSSVDNNEVLNKRFTKFAANGHLSSTVNSDTNSAWNDYKEDIPWRDRIMDMISLEYSNNSSVDYPESTVSNSDFSEVDKLIEGIDSTTAFASDTGSTSLLPLDTVEYSTDNIEDIKAENNLLSLDTVDCSTDNNVDIKKGNEINNLERKFSDFFIILKPASEMKSIPIEPTQIVQPILIEEINEQDHHDKINYDHHIITEDYSNDNDTSSGSYPIESYDEKFEEENFIKNENFKLDEPRSLKRKFFIASDNFIINKFEKSTQVDFQKSFNLPFAYEKQTGYIQLLKTHNGIKLPVDYKSTEEDNECEKQITINISTDKKKFSFHFHINELELKQMFLLLYLNQFLFPTVRLSSIDRQLNANKFDGKRPKSLLPLRKKINCKASLNLVPYIPRVSCDNLNYYLSLHDRALPEQIADHLELQNSSQPSFESNQRICYGKLIEKQNFNIGSLAENNEIKTINNYFDGSNPVLHKIEYNIECNNLKERNCNENITKKFDLFDYESLSESTYDCSDSCEFDRDFRENEYFASCSYTESETDSKRKYNYRKYNPYKYINRDNFTVYKKTVEYYETIEYNKKAGTHDYETIKTTFTKLPKNSTIINNSNKFCRNWNPPSDKYFNSSSNNNFGNENFQTPKYVKRYCRTSLPKSMVRLPPLISKKILKQTTRSEIDKYDPFASAEQQMLELFSSADRQHETSNNNKNINMNRNNLNNNNNNNNTQASTDQVAPIPSPVKSPVLTSKTPPTKSPLFTSKTPPTESPLILGSSPVLPSTTPPIKSPPLTSAFAVYNKRTSWESLPLDNNESNNNINDNDSLDASFYPLNKHIEDIDSEVLLNNLESCSVVSIDSVIDCNKNASLSGKYLRSNSEQLIQKPNNSDVTFANAVLTTGIVKSNSAGGARSSTKKVNMQQMLFGNSSPPPQHTNLVSAVASSNDITPDVDTETANLLEECEAELLLELEKMFNNNPKKCSPAVSPPSSSHLPDIHHQSSFPVCSSADDRPESIENKESSDKKSIGHTIDSAYSSLTRVLSEGDSAKSEQARFCHECGTQYPIVLAKFCCYCGMKRIAL